MELPEGTLHLEIINRYPHDPTAFTQGLIYRDGRLYESTGLHGQSSLRHVDLETGATIESVALADRYFGEGLERVGDQLVQLTWKNETALVYDLDTLNPVGWIPYDGEGWGLCQLDVDTLVTSDGTNQLTLRHSATFEALRTVAVTDNGRPVDRLNELECVGSDVWANIWQADTIVRINPDTGTITSTVDASDLLPPSHRANAGDLNGIAYRSDTGTFLLTGKNWPFLYEVTFGTAPTTVD